MNCLRMIIVAMFMQRSYLSIVLKLHDGLESGLHVFAQLKSKVFFNDLPLLLPN